MPEQDRLFTRQRIHLLALIFTLTASISMLTYSARIESTDTLFLFDATASLVRFGDDKLGTSAGVRPIAPHDLPRGAPYPLPTVGSEVLQIVLASSLYWLAEHVPGIGLVHAVYLFNIMVSAAAVTLMFCLALRLGYGERTAVVASVLFGFATILWPYSKTFFQEPLTLLLLLATGQMIEQWRAKGYHSLITGLAGLACFIGAVLSKGAALFALPALLILALPNPTVLMQRRHWLRLAGGALIIAAGIGLFLAIFGDSLGVSERIERIIVAIRRGRHPFLGTALHTYLLSIGGSIWGTSPILLLALPGGWLLRRRGYYRHVAAALMLLSTFVLAYSLLPARGDWFGGLSWPPRFLIPIVPFVFVLALPVIDQALNSPKRRLFFWLLFVLTIYSLWVQFSGVSLPWEEYFRALPPEAGGVASWGGGLNDVRYLRWVVTPGLWSRFPLDFAWVRTGAPAVALIYVALALCSVYFLLRLIQAPSKQQAQTGLVRLQSGLARRSIPAAPILVSLFFAATVFSLFLMSHDNHYQAYNEPLEQMLPIIRAETEPGDVLLLSDLTYKDFFLNYGKFDHPRVISLPFHPGEQPSPEQPPQIVSDNPDVLLHQTSAPQIHALAESRERLWLLASSGPFLPWSVRPVERFMAAHYYPLREIETAPTVRLIEYSTISAPDPFAFRGPEYLTDLVYADSVRLVGYTLPIGFEYSPGEVLPISLNWQADTPLERNLTIAWFLRNSDDSPAVQGIDSEPGSGFAPTSLWTPGVPVWDNRALRLPADLAPGEYRLWVVVYGRNEFAEIENLPVSGSETREGFIGVLPTVIQVHAPD